VFGFVMLFGADSLGPVHVDTLMWGGVFVSLIAALVGLDFALIEGEFDFVGALYTAAKNDRIKAIGLFEGRLAVLIFRPLG
jgi:hypothetical protein